MKHFIFSVRDNAVDSYAQPFFGPSVGHAVRSFNDAVNREDNNSQLYLHPEDFELFHIGYFEDSDATFEVHTPVQVARGKDVKVPK